MDIPVAIARGVVNSDPTEFDKDQAVMLQEIDAAAVENGGEHLTEAQVWAIFGEYADEVLRLAAGEQSKED